MEITFAAAREARQHVNCRTCFDDGITRSYLCRVTGEAVPHADRCAGHKLREAAQRAALGAS